MSEPVSRAATRAATRADDILRLFAAAPMRFGLRLGPGAARSVLLEALAALGLRPTVLPPGTDLSRLTGGTDLAATLAAGRPVRAAGLLEQPGRIFALQAAERWEASKLAAILAAHDAGRCGLIALDDGTEEEPLPAALVERCVLSLDGDEPVAAPASNAAPGMSVSLEPAWLEGLAGASLALGIASMRPLLAAGLAARLLAEIDGETAVLPAHAARAAELVLAPRATRLPQPAEPPPPPEPEQEQEQPDAVRSDSGQSTEVPAELILEACLASLPPGLLASLAGGTARRGTAGRKGARAGQDKRGRPIGARSGLPRGGYRLNLLATLHAAAPFQALRGRKAPHDLLRIRKTDLQVWRCRPQLATTTIFAVDASGSLAMTRLAEAKGAVELLLADCYRRRDRVAVVAFRGPAASLLLEPTRAPARARRQLAGLPGGGGTPLADGITLAARLAEATVRRGETPTIVLLTDGGGNIGRSGLPGRQAAQEDAEAAARTVRRGGHRCLLIDTTRAGSPRAGALAQLMGARYVLLPRANAAALRDAVRAG